MDERIKAKEAAAIAPQKITAFFQSSSNILLCPLSRLIMLAPVTAEDGYTYERSAIIDWLRKRKVSPVTKAKMGSRLYKNLLIKNIIDYFLEKYPRYKHIQQQNTIKQNESPRVYKVTDQALFSNKSLAENKGYAIGHVMQAMLLDAKVITDFEYFCRYYLSTRLLDEGTHEIFERPIVASDGKTYEAEVFFEWYLKHKRNYYLESLSDPIFIGSRQLRKFIIGLHELKILEVTTWKEACCLKMNEEINHNIFKVGNDGTWLEARGTSNLINMKPARWSQRAVETFVCELTAVIWATTIGWFFVFYVLFGGMVSTSEPDTCKNMFDIHFNPNSRVQNTFIVLFDILMTFIGTPFFSYLSLSGLCHMANIILAIEGHYIDPGAEVDDHEQPRLAVDSGDLYLDDSGPAYSRGDQAEFESAGEDNRNNSSLQC